MKELNANYWTDRYQENQTGWDLGQVSPPLKAYIDQLANKNQKILIPGCGRGYEGIYLWNEGFKNVHLADFSQAAISEVRKICPDFPTENLHCIDFFEASGTYDLIMEQTMFCAIHPSTRREYLKKVSELLAPNGKMVGLLFNRDFEDGPPFGGSQEEYLQIFDEFFEMVLMEDCHNSVEPRSGSELFFIAKKK
jgi:methyl halide transferase